MIYRVFFVFACLFGYSFAQSAPKIAILTIQGDQSSTQAQQQAITERLQAELIATSKFVVLDRNQIDMILKEQGFTNSGICDNSECQVQIGQLLGVEKIITGRVVDFAALYAFSLNYIDVATGVIEHTVSIEQKGELVNVLSQGTKRLSARLVDKVFPPIVVPPAVEQEALAVQPQPIKPIAVTPPHKNSTSLIAAIALDCVGAALLAYGLVQSQDADTQNSEYTALPAGTEQAVFNAEWDDVKAAQLRSRIGLWSGALLLAAGVTVHIAF